MQPVDLYEELNAAGVLPDSLVRLDETATPRHIRYLDLLGGRDDRKTVLPDAVIESSGQPYLYVVRRDRLGDSGHAQTHLAELIRILACRSDARFLAVVKPGSIDVYPVGLFERVPDVPDGHFKIPHLWPVKFPQAGRLNYQLFGLAGSDFLSW